MIKDNLFLDSFKSIKLWQVWWFLGTQDIKVRFRRSFIGPLWILINMAIFVGGAGLVYGLLFGQPMHEFLPYLALGFVIWGFIVSSLTESGLTFINAEGYIKQFSFPKQIYLMRTLVVYTIIFLIGLSVLIPVQLFFGSFYIVNWLYALPGLVLLLLTVLGHIVISAYLGARFRDLPHAMGGILQVMFFLTPILFPIKLLKERNLDFIYQYNPLYYLIDIFRHPILEGEFSASENYIIASLYMVMIWVIAIIVARQNDSKLVFLL